MILNSDEINIFGDKPLKNLNATTKNNVKTDDAENTKINKFGDGIDWENHVHEILNSNQTVFYDKNHCEEKINKIKKYKQSGKVLDCGCHIGRWIEVFRDNNYDYIGVDQSIEAIETAKRYKPNGKFVHSLLWDMSFDNEFDIVHTNAVLQHNILSEQEKILPKINRSLKINGILVITESTELKQTMTQRTYQGWITFVEKYGFKFMESWHKNPLGLEDNYLFIKTENFKPKNISYSHGNITKNELQNLLKNKASNKIQEIIDIEPHISEITIPELPTINITTTLTTTSTPIAYNQEQLSNKSVDMNKIWDSYLSIAKKAETNGFGNDHSEFSTCLETINSKCKHFPVEKYPTVLNLRCGDGGESKVMIDKGYKVTGLTFGKDNIKMAKDLYNIDLLEMDMNVPNLKNNSFDVVYMSHAFEHIFSPFITCIEIWRLLKVKGICFICVPSPDNKNAYDGLWHYNLLYPNQIKNLFEMCGFKQLHSSEEIRNENISFNLVFEKLPIHKISKWNYLKFIHEARNKC